MYCCTLYLSDGSQAGLQYDADFGSGRVSAAGHGSSTPAGMCMHMREVASFEWTCEAIISPLGSTFVQEKSTDKSTTSEAGISST